jgi:Flp pilus assembly protein TadD
MPDTGSEFHAKPTDRQQFQVHIDFGRAFETQGNLDAAVKEYQDALAVIQAKRRGPFRPSDEALAHRRMASALDRQGRFVQAEAHYNKALKLSPKDPKVWNDAGYSYYLQGRWADAERALKTAARLAPDDERVRINLGLTLAASGRHDEALPLLGQATGDAVAHANLGYLLAATGQNDLARQQYETAIAMRPDLEVARRALARIALSESGSNAKRPDRTSVADGKNSPGPRVDKGVSQTKATATNGRPARDERGIENDQPLKLRAD